MAPFENIYEHTRNGILIVFCTLPLRTKQLEPRLNNAFRLNILLLAHVYMSAMFCEGACGASAKRIDPDQPAQSAQADLSRHVLPLVKCLHIRL